MITDQAATEQTRYLAAPVCTPRSADRPRSTPSAAKLIITRLLCTRWRAPRRNNSGQPQSAESRSRHYADRIICTWITLFAKPKSKLFFFCLFLVSTALAQKTCSVKLCCKPACLLTKITLYNCRATANRTVL